MQEVNVQTTQNVWISYKVASLGDRILAYLIDSLILGGYIISVFVLGSVLFQIDDDMVWIFVVFYLPLFFYHLLFEVFRNGQSPGKQQMKIKVVKMDGTAPGLGSYLLRWILRPIDLFFYGGVVILCIVIGGKGQRLGDLAAGTAVIKLSTSVDNPKQQVIKNLETDYNPVYPEANLLADKDIDIMLQALKHFRETGNKEPVLALDEKIRQLLRINPDMEPVAFLNTLVKDFNHFSTHG